ncbi:DUF4434 domain-containing protein [Dyella sp. BiH032]|uniref:DUF4434 domain-containing protein n=1 Tax=Dyella sp. BiH032 TaxID=3075430 RepID=UPI0028930925|nr:DUF4434 domain-containing protein [Dyella sp. BiH032]WNL44635.1 DUF4434 domain-containing protein [Dyella sp. BiH032]
MVTRLRWPLALVLLLASWLADAATALFYQPQLRDRDVAAAQWPGVFAQVRGRGFDTLVVQWTQYGDAFGDEAGHAWLLQRVREAHAAGLRIVLGLHSDPAFFQRQEMPVSSLDDYLRTLARQDAEVARRWLADLGEAPIAGWYLPMEIDDRRWREPEAREALRDYLALERRQLDRVAVRPVYVSTFFAGHMAPAGYAALLADVRRAGVRPWVQDGAGTGRLSRGESAVYLAAAASCDGQGAVGVVYEVFRQVGSDAAFKAVPLGERELGVALAQRAPCGGDSLFFELRYLEGMGVLRGD